MKMQSNELEIQPTFIRKQERKRPVRSPPPRPPPLLAWNFPALQNDDTALSRNAENSIYTADNLKTARSAN